MNPDPMQLVELYRRFFDLLPTESYRTAFDLLMRAQRHQTAANLWLLSHNDSLEYGRILADLEALLPRMERKGKSLFDRLAERIGKS